MRTNTSRKINSILPFCERLQSEAEEIRRMSVSTLQINLGRLCNLACLHCHVEAGPKRTESMTLEAIDRILGLVDASTGIKVLDLTGGAPEMNPHFRYFVKAGRARGLDVIDRCNITVFFEAGYENIPEFLAENQVHVVASLPCYTKNNVEKQRGGGVFDKSIEGLKLLNRLGYGKTSQPLRLDLVYNPLGASLPPNQRDLEIAYKQELKEMFDIEFNNLYAITNMPIKRFLHQLRRDGHYESYMELLAASFNPAALEGVMCKNMLSIGWDGEVFDCDFNQMLALKPSTEKTAIWDLGSFESYVGDRVSVGDHCYGCTAGAGSSCGGAIA